MPPQTVHIIDDDAGLRDSLSLLLETANLNAACHASAEDFLAACHPDMEGCLLLDVRMPGMSGPELQEELARRGVTMPIIFLTAYAEIRTGIEAMKRGAVEFVSKPFNGAALLTLVHDALARNRAQREGELVRRRLRDSLQRLTLREREVLSLALAGHSNKEIAAHLSVSLRTVEGHRSRILLKFDVRSLLDLSQHAAAAGVALNQWVTETEGAREQ